MVPTAERLGASHPTYVPDLPGFGRSSRPAHALRVPEQADVLAAWMRAGGPRRAALLGNSMGCQVLVDLAVRHPEHVDRLLLVSPTMDPDAGGLLGTAMRAALDALREPASLLPIIAVDYLTAGPLRFLRTFRDALLDPMEEKLRRVGVPVLAVSGGLDPIAPPRWAERVCRLAPAGRLVVLPRAAHAINYSHPDELARVVLPFLAGGTRAAPVCPSARLSRAGPALPAAGRG
jgi:pimeloyl-ACP methyl ester carboxylesterase